MTYLTQTNLNHEHNSGGGLFFALRNAKCRVDILFSKHFILEHCCERVDFILRYTPTRLLELSQ